MHNVSRSTKLSITGLTFWVCECNGYNRNDYDFFYRKSIRKNETNFFPYFDYDYIVAKSP